MGRIKVHKLPTLADFETLDVLPRNYLVRILDHKGKTHRALKAYSLEDIYKEFGVNSWLHLFRPNYNNSLDYKPLVIKIKGFSKKHPILIKAAIFIDNETFNKTLYCAISDNSPFDNKELYSHDELYKLVLAAINTSLYTRVLNKLNLFSKFSIEKTGILKNKNYISLIKEYENDIVQNITDAIKNKNTSLFKIQLEEKE